MRNTIKQIVFEEFSRVVTNIESDFRSNYVRKRYNFLLSQLDENMTANMVFVQTSHMVSHQCSFLVICPLECQGKLKQRYVDQESSSALQFESSNESF